VLTQTHDLQIFKAIVESIAIDVMHNLNPAELATQKPFHHKAVLKHLLASYRKPPIALDDASRSVGRFWSAAEFASSLFSVVMQGAKILHKPWTRTVWCRTLSKLGEFTLAPQAQIVFMAKPTGLALILTVFDGAGHHHRWHL